MTFTFSKRMAIFFSQIDETGRLDRSEEMCFLTWNKLPVKSFSFESRRLLWGKLRLHFIIITTPLLLPQGWEDFQIFVFRIWLGFWGRNPWNCGASLRLQPQGASHSVLLCTHLRATHHLFTFSLQLWPKHPLLQVKCSQLCLWFTYLSRLLGGDFPCKSSPVDPRKSLIFSLFTFSFCKAGVRTS